MPATEDEAPFGAIYFEFTAIGRSVKVVAVHAATALEVSAVGPRAPTGNASSEIRLTFCRGI
jgi:hypothetical protein